jgi:hypothetical protein
LHMSFKPSYPQTGIKAARTGESGERDIDCSVPDWYEV